MGKVFGAVYRVAYAARRVADAAVNIACVLAAVYGGINTTILEDNAYRQATDSEWADMVIKRARVLRGKMGL